MTMADNWEEFLLKTKFTTEGAEETAAKVESIGAAVQDSQQATIKIGTEVDNTTNKVAANLGKIESGLSKIGLGQISGPVSGIGQLAIEINNLGKESDSIKNLAGGFTTLIPALSPAAAGLLAVAAPVAAIAAIGLAAGLALKALNDEIEKNVQATKDALTANEKKTNQEIANIPIERTRTPQENLQIANDQQADIQLKEKELADAQKIKADIDRQYADLGGSFNPAQRKQLGEQGDAAQKEIDRLIGVLNDMRAEAVNTVTVLGPAIDARAAENKAVKDNTVATNARLAEITRQATQEQAIATLIRTGTKESIQARLDAIEADKKYTDQQIKALEALPEPTGEVTAKLAELRRHFLDLGEESTKLSTAIGYLPAELKKNAKELADVTSQIIDVNAKRREVEKNRLTEDQRAAETSSLQAQIERAKEKESIQASNDRKAQINQSYMDNELKALASYRDTEEKATKDHNKARIRQLQDLYTSLVDLGASRDVAGFISTRARGLTAIARGDEDSSDASNERRKQYQAGAAERQKQYQAQLAQEQAAGQVRLKQSEKLQQQLTDLQQRYAQQDLQARRRSEDDAYRVQITGLQQRQKAIAQIVVTSINPAVTSVYNLGTSIVGFINRITSASSAIKNNTPAGVGFGYAQTAYKPSNVTVNVAGVGALVSQSQLNSTVNNIVKAVHVATGGY